MTALFKSKICWTYLKFQQNMRHFWTTCTHGRKLLFIADFMESSYINSDTAALFTTAFMIVVTQ